MFDVDEIDTCTCQRFTNFSFGHQSATFFQTEVLKFGKQFHEDISSLVMGLTLSSFCEMKILLLFLIYSRVNGQDVLGNEYFVRYMFPAPKWL